MNGAILILARTTPIGEDQSRGRIRQARMAPNLRPKDPAGRVPSKGMALLPGPSQPHDYLPMFFFKAKVSAAKSWFVCLLETEVVKP